MRYHVEVSWPFEKPDDPLYQTDLTLEAERLHGRLGDTGVGFGRRDVEYVFEAGYDQQARQFAEFAEGWPEYEVEVNPREEWELEDFKAHLEDLSTEDLVLLTTEVARIIADRQGYPHIPSM
jgi:hypothetical protein